MDEDPQYVAKYNKNGLTIAKTYKFPQQTRRTGFKTKLWRFLPNIFGKP